MKKVLIIALMVEIMFSILGQECVLAKDTKTSNKLYNYNSRGQREGYNKVTYSKNKIYKVETYDNGGKRLSVSKN